MGWVTTADAVAEWLVRSKTLPITVIVQLSEGLVDHPCIDVLFAQAVRLRGLTIWCWHSDTEPLIARMRVPMARGHRLEELRVYPFPSAQFHPWTYAGALPPAIALESRCLEVVSMPLAVRINTVSLPLLQHLTICMTPWSATFWASLGQCRSLKSLHLLAGKGRRHSDPPPPRITLPNLDRVRSGSHTGSLFLKEFMSAPRTCSLEFTDSEGGRIPSYLDIIHGMLSPHHLCDIVYFDVGGVAGIPNLDLLGILRACAALKSVRFRAVRDTDQKRTGVFTCIFRECYSIRRVRVVTNLRDDELPHQWLRLRDCAGMDCKLEVGSGVR